VGAGSLGPSHKEVRVVWILKLFKVESTGGSTKEQGGGGRPTPLEGCRPPPPGRPPPPIRAEGQIFKWGYFLN